MRKKIAVLGAGLVGKAMAIDLSVQFDVMAIDLDEDVLNSLGAFDITTKRINFADKRAIMNAISSSDLVVGAVPGFMGFEIVRTVIEAGKNMVDISFFAEDPFALDDLAKDKNVTIVTDCGVAPGMANIILGHHDRKMKIESYECLVGGLPVVREWPWEYKAVFSPTDAIEEYIRPARFVQNNSVIIREALSDPELIHFNGVGTLESWNSDGLRTLIQTMTHIPNMIEKTLRYPGSIEYLRVLRETGFFSKDEIEVKGLKVRPIDLTAKLLFPKWKLQSDEREFTVMRIRLEGTENDGPKKYEYSLLNHTDEQTGTLSMARTTGYTCAAVANLVLSGAFQRKGICPPEFVGAQEGSYDFVMEYLRQRGVDYRVT